MALGTPGFSNIDGGGGGGGAGVPLNFSQTKGAQVTITAAEAKPATVVSVTITTAGNPVQIIVSGDANPSGAGTWGLLNIYRGAVAIGQNVQFESSAANENVPYSLQVVDEPAAGTWTYSLKVDSVTANTQFGESAGPIITVTELGGVGTAVPSGAAGGDLGGTYPNPDVVAIQGYSVSTTAPGAGEALVWDGSNWVPTAVSAGAGGNNTNIQYNSGSSLAGTNNFIFDDTLTRVTLTDGSQALDVYPNLIEYVGGGSLQIEASTTVDVGTLTATGVNLGSATAATTIAGAFTLPTADGASGEVLTTDGSGNVSWQAGGGGGSIGGTILATEVAFGTALDTVSGSSTFTYDSLNNTVALDKGTNLSGILVRDTPLTVTSDLQAGALVLNSSTEGATLSGTGVFLEMRYDTLVGQIPTIRAIDETTAAAPLDLSIGELRLNTAPGAAGEVLTSNGPGLAPTWEAPQVLQSVYVAEGADSAIANGSPAFPYATISAAIAAITDASPTKRYAISVAGGAYSEGATLNIKPNVFIVGAAVGAVRITATTFGMDASFSAGSGVDNRSGYQNVILTGACVFDWSAVTSSAGKLYFTSVTFNSAVTMTGHNNTIAQSQFTSCQFFGTLTVSGINVGVFANNIVFSDIVLNQHPSLATIFSTAGGYCSGTLTATTTINTFARRISIFARSFWMDTVTVDGPQTYLDYTVDSLPAAGATVLNGATLVSIDTGTGADKNLSNLNFPTAVNNPIIPAATNATNFGDWGFQWFWSFAYLHASTGTDCYLISYPSAFGAETGPGKNVYVYADGAGLAADVSGGIVGLYTSNATGTGSSGLIEAETGSSANGDSGNIRFTTGTPSGSGRRGTVVMNSPLTHPYGTIAVAAPTATALRTHPTYLTSQAAITLPTMLAADDGLRIEIVTTVPSVVTPPSGAANQRAMTTRGGSTWIWINGSTDWFCISAI